MTDAAAGGEGHHVVVTVPTCGSPEGLARLLTHLAEQVRDAAERARVTVVVVDNDPSERARDTVARARRGGLAVEHVVEPTAGIPFARNACVRAALARDADALIFLDDDEWPAPGWLAALLATWQRTGADIVQGPARGVLPDDAPAWAARSGVFDKDRALPEAAPIRTAYSYNTLVARRVLDALGPTFDPVFRYTGSSDHHWFKQAAEAGMRAVWSPAALVYEEVGAHRARLRWVLARGYRVGAGAARSAALRRGALRAAPRVLALAVANGGYAVLRLVASSWRRAAWVEGLRRAGIAAGLLVGGPRPPQEYRRRVHVR